MVGEMTIRKLVQLQSHSCLLLPLLPLLLLLVLLLLLLLSLSLLLWHLASSTMLPAVSFLNELACCCLTEQ
jgi:hypothetical protein